MKLNINYPQLAAEFVIVFVGVAVALAADSWREGLVEKSTEEQYLLRLLSDLEAGKNWLESQDVRYQEVISDLVFLSNFDATYNISDEELVDAFVKAVSYGGATENYSHDDTYQELLSTGRLNVISNTDVRERLWRYFRFANGQLKRSHERLPNYFLTTFRSLTGYTPVDSDFGKKLDSDSKQRILQFLESNSTPEFESELRALHALVLRHHSNIVNALERNKRLIDEIHAESVDL
jgi:hypothetical protein